MKVDSLDIPSIVMIGSQSSGKSTLINKIAGFDISPTGNGLEQPLH